MQILTFYIFSGSGLHGARICRHVCFLAADVLGMSSLSEQSLKPVAHLLHI